MPKLTKSFVEGIRPDKKSPLKFWDSELKGFGVVVLPSGRRTYCIQYRNVDHIKKRLKIGVHGHITAEEARSSAKIQLGQVTSGTDLASKAKQVRNAPTFTQLFEDYVKFHGQKKKESSFKEDQRLLKKIILPVFGSMKIQNITKRDIEAFHASLARKRYSANRVIALLSKMFTLAVSWGWREDHPVKGLQRYQEEKRDRWLNHEELQRFWSVLDKYPHQLTAYVLKFLLLTGARKGEVLKATWDQFDLEKGIWTKPSHLTKQNKKEHLPLSDKAIEMLYQVQKLTPSSQRYVFPGRVQGQHLKEPRTFWNRVVREANLEKVRIHDLRHTHASHLVSSGLSLSIVGKLLGHTQASTTQRYAHLADEPLRQATQLFSTKVGEIGPKDNV